MCGKERAGEANILIVEVGHVGTGKIFAFHADVDEKRMSSRRAAGDASKTFVSVPL